MQYPPATDAHIGSISNTVLRMPIPLAPFPTLDKDLASLIGFYRALAEQS